jgi:hypothetical protein
MGFMVLDPNNDRGHQIDGVSEKGQEYQAVRIFGKDSMQITGRMVLYFLIA